MLFACVVLCDFEFEESTLDQSPVEVCFPKPSKGGESHKQKREEPDNAVSRNRA